MAVHHHYRPEVYGASQPSQPTLLEDAVHGDGEGAGCTCLPQLR